MISKLSFVLRRRWPILVLIPLVTTVVVVLLTPPPVKPPVEYTATYFVAGEPRQVSSANLRQASVDIRRGAVVDRAKVLAGMEDASSSALVRRVTVRVEADAVTLAIAARASTRTDAENLAAGFAQGFIDFAEERYNKEQVEEIQRLTEAREEAELVLALFLRDNQVALTQNPVDPAIDVQRRILQDRLAQAEADYNQRPSLAEVPFRVAGTIPATEVDPPKLQLPQSRSVRSVLALLLAATGAVLVVALMERINPRVDSPAEAEAIVGAPALGMIPIMKGKRRQMLERAELDVFSGPFAESFRSIRSHLDFRSTTEELGRPPCVMIVSSLPNEGKTTTAAFLSLSYAEVGREVVAIGADFRRPALHRLFGMPRNPGLSSRLLSNEKPQRAEDVVRNIVRRDDRTGVRVIPSGPGTDRVTGLLGDLSAVTKAGIESGCTVVLDTAPVLVANDAVDFLPLADYVIVVVRLGRTTERALRQSIASLDLSEAKVAGCAIMGSLESSDAKRYYYSYYRVDDDTEANARAAREEAARRDADVAATAPASD